MRLLGALFLGAVVMTEIGGGVICHATARSALAEIEGTLALGFGVLTLTVMIVGVRLGKLIEGLPAAIQARAADAPRAQPVEVPREPALRALDMAGPGTDYVNPRYRR